MSRVILFTVMILVLAGCTIDENGIRDPVSEAKAAATRAAIDTDKKGKEIDLSIKEQNALTKAETERAKLKIEQLQAETQAQRDRLIAEAEAEARRETLIEQGKASAQIMRAFADAARIILILGAVAGVIWIAGRSVAGAYNAMAAARYVKIGVEPGTLLPPPLVIVDGYLLDTRSGERARLRDPASVNRLKLAATTRNTETAQLARAATEIARSTKSAQPADQLPLMSASVPTLDTSEVGNE